MKQQLLESFGFAPQERFPVFADRFPIQLLSYLRLSRIQDPGLFAKVINNKESFLHLMLMCCPSVTPTCGTEKSMLRCT